MDALARSYYRALDDHDYETLEEILAPGFTQERPDQTLEGRERFIEFMRAERPDTDTSHEVVSVYRNDTGLAVQGTVYRADGSAWFEFVDLFTVEDDQLTTLETFVR